MRSRLRRLLGIGLVLIIFLFAAFVWLTRYRHDHLEWANNTVPVRIDRFTGDAEMLLFEGWKKMESSKSDGLASGSSGLQ
jgi:hypothetical protein